MRIARERRNVIEPRRWHRRRRRRKAEVGMYIAQIYAPRSPLMRGGQCARKGEEGEGEKEYVQHRERGTGKRGIVKRHDGRKR